MTAVETAWSDYVKMFDDYQIEEFRNRFLAEDYLELPNFGPDQIRVAIAGDVKGLLDSDSRRKSVNIRVTGNTPRYLEVVGRDAIDAKSSVIRETYHSAALRAFLAQVVKAPDVIAIPYAPEEFVISRMTQTGDVHGWHWDDYPYALVWIVEAPQPGMGGSLEYVRGTEWNKQNPRVEEYLRTGTVDTRHPAAGSVYLLRADTSMHRVAPLTREGGRRSILCFSYAVPEDLERQVSHETVDFYS